MVDILKELLADYAHLGDPALRIDLSKDYPTLEYTVQYRESDLDFARRQMERHGISFRFDHHKGSHTLVLTDDVLGHPIIGARPFKSYDGHHQAEGEHFWEWAPVHLRENARRHMKASSEHAECGRLRGHQ